MLEIVEVLKFGETLFQVGDRVNITFDNGKTERGFIKFFGLAEDTTTCEHTNHIQVGKYMVTLREVINIEKV